MRSRMSSSESCTGVSTRRTRTARFGSSYSPVPGARSFGAETDQAATEKPGPRHSDPTGKSHAEFIEYWQRMDATRVGYWTHLWSLGKPIIAAGNGWGL